MNKFLLAMLLILSIFARAAAQDDDYLDSLPIPPLPPEQYLPLGGDTCQNPAVENFSLIHYQTYSKAYMEIKGVGSASPLTSVGFKELGVASDYQPRNLQPEGGLLLNNLLPGHLYTVQTTNSCGLPVTFAFEVNRDFQELISVPEPLFDAIGEYIQKNDHEPFPNFLNNLTGISPYVKIAFIQQYFHKGEPFDNDLGDLMPYVPPLEPDTCFCNAIYTSTFAKPGGKNESSGLILPEAWPGSGIKYTLDDDNDAKYWYEMHNKGAAKWHQLYTEGRKAEKGVDWGHELTWADGSNGSQNYVTSYQQSKIRINLLCMDGDRMPKNCACEKEVKYWYRYDTRLNTEARTYSSGSGSKNAVAQVEDMAIVSFFEEFDVENTYKGLDFLLKRHISRCDRAAKTTFWTKMLNLYKSQLEIGLSIVGFKNTKAIDTLQLRKLSNAVIKHLENFKVLIDDDKEDLTNCDQDKHIDMSMEGTTTKTIRPNSPAVIVINSFDKLYSGGRRSWFSTAQVVSDFYLAANILPNAWDGTPVHCCSPNVATWVTSAFVGSPWTIDNLRDEVREYIKGAGFTGSSVILSRDFGVLKQNTSKAICDRLPVNPEDGGGITGGSEDRNFDISKFSSLTIWDATGRLVAQFQAQDSQFANMDTLIQDRLANISAGVYFVRTQQNGQISTRKIMIR